MGRQLKTWGGSLFITGKQCRTIVATYTKTRALELLEPYNVSKSYFNNHWDESRNTEEVNITTNDPETIFYTNNKYVLFREYKKLE